MIEARQLNDSVGSSQTLSWLPIINRSRDYHVYDLKGRRYLDMYLAGGTAIFGHRPPGLRQAIKNALGRGLLADYPSVYQKRLSQTLGRLFPDWREFRVFANPEQALAFVEKHLGRAPLFKDPAVCRIKDEDCCLWRPFLPSEEQSGQVIWPVIPLPGLDKPVAIGFRHKLPTELKDPDFPAPLSPFLAAASLKALELFKKPQIRQKSPLSSFDPAISPVKSDLWQQKGPYMAFTGKPEAYPRIFRQALQAGVILNPCCSGPSIIPGEFSDGEVKMVGAAFASPPSSGQAV